MHGALGRTFALSGKRKMAMGILRKLRELAKRRYVSPFEFASIHFALGQADLGFRWLAQARQDRAFELTAIKVDPAIRPPEGGSEVRRARPRDRPGIAPYRLSLVTVSTRLRPLGQTSRGDYHPSRPHGPASAAGLQEHARPSDTRALVPDPGHGGRGDHDQLPRPDGPRHRRSLHEPGPRPHRRPAGSRVLRLLVELRRPADPGRRLPGSVRNAGHLLHRRRDVVVLHRSHGRHALTAGAHPDPHRRGRLRGSVFSRQQPDPRHLVSAAGAGPRQRDLLVRAIRRPRLPERAPVLDRAAVRMARGSSSSRAPSASPSGSSGGRSIAIPARAAPPTRRRSTTSRRAAAATTRASPSGSGGATSARCCGSGRSWAPLSVSSAATRRRSSSSPGSRPTWSRRAA